MGLYSEFKKNKVTGHGIPAKIMVIGVGGAGGNTVDHIYELGIKGVNLLICNTDSKALNKSRLEDTQKICMGDGTGAGNDAEVGRQMAIDSLPVIRQYVQQHQPRLIFITAGMGGGTGTGAAPVIAQMVHSLGIPQIAILTTPDADEGKHRMKQALNGIQIMQEFVDTFIIIRNETIASLCNEMSVVESFNMANNVVAYAAKGIAEIALTQSDLVSVDISDVCKVVRNSHYAVMGMASEEGTDRVKRAIESAVLSELFGKVPIAGAQEVLVNFATSSSSGLKMKEVKSALSYIQEIAAGTDSQGNKDAVNIIWGTSVKPELEDKIEVIIVITGFQADNYYKNIFNGQLNLSIDTRSEVNVEPAQPTPPITISVEPTVPQTPKAPQTPQTLQTPKAPQTPQTTPPQVHTPQSQPAQIVTTAPAVQRPVTKPTVAPATQSQAPAQPSVQSMPQTPAQTPAQPAEQAPVQPAAVEPWRVPVPERVVPRSVPPQSVVSSYQIDANTPAYKSRRGMMLLNEIKGKKVIIKMDGSVVSNDEVVSDTTQQQALDF